MGFKFPDLESGRTVKLVDAVFCKEDARFFAQSEDKDPTELNSQINDEIAAMKETTGKPKVGEMFICQYEADHLWYRAQVIHVTRGGIVTVEFVDYGNEELYSRDKWLKNAREPPIKFKEPNMMCIKMCDVKIAGNKDIYDLDLIERLAADRIKNKFTFEPTHDMHNADYDPETSVATGHMRVNGVFLSEMAEKKDEEAVAVSNIIVSSPTPTSSVFAAEVTIAEYPIDKRDGKCFISYFEDELYLCHSDEYQAREDFNNELNNRIDDEPVGDIKKGDYVAAMEDGIYYRAKVTDIKDNTFEVFFCDYGNTANVSREQLKCLPSGMKSTSKFIFPVSTNVAHYQETINKWANEENPSITVTNGKLAIEGLEPLEYLSAHCPIPDQSGIGGNCFITRFEGDLLICADFAGREKLNAELDAFIRTSGWPLANGHSGVTCAALHEGAYYRAEILDTVIDLNKSMGRKGDDQVNVRFADHGNFATVSMADIMHLPAQFSKHAKFASEIKVDGHEILVTNRDTIRKWEDEEEPNIEVKNQKGTTMLFIDGKTIGDYFNQEPTSQPVIESMPVDKIVYSYAQYNVGKQYDFIPVEVNGNTLMGYMKEEEARLIRISETLKQDIDQDFDHTTRAIKIGDMMAIYDDIFGEGEEYLRCQIMAIDEGFTVKVVDYGITRKVDRVFLLDVDKHKGVDWELGGLILNGGSNNGIVELFEPITVNLTSKLADGNYNYELFSNDAIAGQCVATDVAKSAFSDEPAISEQKSDDQVTCDSIEEAITVESPPTADRKVTVVVTNVRAGSDGYHMTCFTEADWALISSLKPSADKSLSIAELNADMDLLIQMNPINRGDYGYRRAKLHDADKRFFMIEDCSKRVCATASHVYRCDNAHADVQPMKLHLANNPGRDIIGRKVNLDITDKTSARLEYTSGDADKLIDQLGELAINKKMDTLTPEPLNNLIHRLQAALELF